MLSRTPLALLTCIALSLFHSSAAASVCDISFNDTTALSNLVYSQQCVSFVNNPNWYSQACPAGRFVTVQERITQYSHWHLAWEDANINCLASNGCFGSSSGGTCANISNHNVLPRYLSTHVGDHWIDFVVSSTPFNIVWTRVRGTQPVDIWVKKAAGNWLWWPNLTPGWWWTQESGIVEITVHSSQPNSFSVDDIRIEY